MYLSSLSVTELKRTLSCFLRIFQTFSSLFSTIGFPSADELIIVVRQQLSFGDGDAAPTFFFRRLFALDGHEVSENGFGRRGTFIARQPTTAPTAPLAATAFSPPTTLRHTHGRISVRM